MGIVDGRTHSVIAISVLIDVLYDSDERFPTGAMCHDFFWLRL